MPIFELQTEDGKTFQVDAPDQATALKSLDEHTAPKISQGAALWEGVKQGATAGLSDELTGLTAAGNLPKGLQGGAKMTAISPLVSALFGGAKLAYEKLYGGEGEASKAYEKARDEARATQEIAREEYPKTDLGGEIAGTAATLPIGAGGGAAATLPLRIGQAARVGAAYGAASGFGEGEGLADSAAKALMGGVTGGVVGAVGAPVLEGAGKLASAVARPVVNAVRGAVAPEDEAARRVVSFTNRGIDVDPGAESRLTPAEFGASRMQPGGGPAMLMDVGGEPARALAKSAANTSPEGRHVLNAAINRRFEEQSQRVIGWMQDTFNYPDAHNLQEAIDQTQKTVNRGIYKRAYTAGDRPIWGPDFEQLTSSPDVVDAMRVAATKGKSRATAEGYGGFNPGVTVDQSGNVTFRKGPGGVPTYPNLQFWDYTKRALDDAASAAGRAGRKDEASYLGQLSRQLRSALDQRVPTYEAARSTAASFFGAENALEAGQNFVNSKMQNRQAIDALAKMTPVERKLFQDGFVSKFIDMLSEVADRRDILNKIANSPGSKQRLMIALGPQKARELEAGLRIEGIMDLARKAVQGNSTTAQQLQELGLAGGSEGFHMPETFAGMAVSAIRAGLTWGRQHVDERVSRRVAEMLASNDHTVFLRGLRVLANNSRMLDALRAADKRLAAIGGEQVGRAVPALQLGVGRADQNQQQPVPRPAAVQ